MTRTVSPQNLRRMLMDDDELALLDVREEGVFGRSHLLFAVNLPLSRLELRKELVTDYADLLPELEPHAWRKIRGQQELITRYAPEQALATLPALLRHQADRQRLQALAEKLHGDERLLGATPTAEQAAMLERIRTVLGAKPERVRGAAVPLSRAS